jgi:hypothetical protein
MGIRSERAAMVMPIDHILERAQRLADELIEECARLRPGDIGGRLMARPIAEFVLDRAVKKREQELVDDSFEG